MCTQLEHDESFPDRSQNWVRRNGFGCVHFLSSEGPADDEFYKYAQNRSVSDASISSENFVGDFVGNFVFATHKVRQVFRRGRNIVVELRRRTYGSLLSCSSTVSRHIRCMREL